jgi:MFS transporter, FHS family, glucose/mannose:H+ symporter
LQLTNLPADRSPSPHALRTLLPVFLYFLAAGVATVMLGPLLPSLIRRWQIQDAQAGTLFTASFVGQFCGAWFATRNLRTSVIYGSAMTAAGCVAMAWAGFGLAHFALFAVGLGLGAGLTAGNVIAGTVVPSARARLIAALNIAWGLGAIACPLLVQLSSARGPQTFFLSTAVFVGVTSLASVAIPRPAGMAVARRTSHASINQESMTGSELRLAPLPLFLFAAAIFVYVGVENALAGWLPTYAIRSNPALQPSFISLCFWISELTGRVVVIALMSLIGDAVLYRLCVMILICTQIVLCTVAPISAAGVVVLTVVAALSLAPLYPLITSFLLARTGNHAKLGVLFACASLGGAILPWLTGAVSTHFHGLRVGLLVPAVGAVLLLFLSRVLTAK